MAKKKFVQPRNLVDAGFRGQNLATMRNILSEPEGLVILAGPTGSGKTTLSVTITEELGERAGKILALEDSKHDAAVLARSSSTKVVPRKLGMALIDYKASTRNPDPDFSFDSLNYGEIRESRDLTKTIAHASEHYTLATCFAKTAAGVLERYFIDQGLLYLTKGTKAIVAQNLLNELCECKEPYQDTSQLVELGLLDIIEEDLEDLVLYRSRGCRKCYYKGYQGKIAVHETLLMSREIEDLLLNGASSQDIHAHVRSSGMPTLVDDAWSQVKEGRTSIEEFEQLL